ncbi:MAG: acyloxyacyl hydrolase [Variovorax sp.]|nr:acyloxyacyl hydrolase [Variovorax sp.]
MKTIPKVHLRAVLAASFLLLWGSAHAFDDQGIRVYVEGGRAFRGGETGGTNSATVGTMIPWTPIESLHTAAMSTYLDLSVTNWHATPVVQDGHRNYLQIGVIPSLRYRLAEGTSPWFVEGGIGAVVMEHLYRTPEHQFSTAFQLTEALGVGRSFGDRGQHEVSLRVQHFSNAGIKEPNPGENFYKVRYGYRF